MSPPETIEVNVASYYVLVTTATQIVAQALVSAGAIPAVSCAVHTSVLEFATKELAERAITRVNQRIGLPPMPSSIYQTALPLY